MSELPIAKKSLGQHWLHDTDALHSIVSAADIKPGEVVLEIGPGTGTLTDELIKAGAEVVALEYDNERFAELTKKYSSYESSQIFVQAGDIRSYDLGSLPDNYKIVANIPYYLTANLMRKLTEDAHKPAVASLLVQKEVAERLAAKPGDLSVVAVATQYYYEVSVGEVIKAELFTPPPKVDSQVVILKLREHPLFEADTKKFFEVVKAGFSERRKKLRSSLSGGLGISKAEAEELLQKAGVDSNKRAQELTLEDWYKISIV